MFRVSKCLISKLGTCKAGFEAECCRDYITFNVCLFVETVVSAKLVGL